MKKDLISTFQSLDARVREATRDYYHSRPLANYTAHNRKTVSIDLRGMLLASAITANNVLLPGTTGAGKTHLSKMFMAGLFGVTGYKTLQMDASFSLDKLRNIAFDVIANGGNLHDAVREADVLTVPGVVIDEYNRAPSEITNIIQGWLQNGALTFEGGKEVHPGVAFNGRERYQWKIATVNEGGPYSGARKLDKASRDRLNVEIPLDVFPLTREDRYKLHSKTSTAVDAYDGAGVLDDVISALQGVRTIPISGTVDEFLLYLQNMNQCIKAPNKTKLEIENFSPETMCRGCHLITGNNNLCGSVYAPSDRSIISLQNLAKGFAVYRCLQTEDDPSQLRVELEDVLAAAPFVLLSKINIHPGWIDKTSVGSRWQAVNNVVKFSYERFTKFIRSNWEYLQQQTTEAKAALKTYAEEKDAWAVDLRS